MQLLLLPGASGVSKVLLGVNEQDSLWAGAALAKLPAGDCCTFGRPKLTVAAHSHTDWRILLLQGPTSLSWARVHRNLLPN